MEKGKFECCMIRFSPTLILAKLGYEKTDYSRNFTLRRRKPYHQKNTQHKKKLDKKNITYISFKPLSCPDHFKISIFV